MIATLHFQIDMGIFIQLGSEPFRHKGRAEHVFVLGIAREKRLRDWSSLVKGPQPFSILPCSCFALLERDDGGEKRASIERMIEIQVGRN